MRFPFFVAAGSTALVALVVACVGEPSSSPILLPPEGGTSDGASPSDASQSGADGASLQDGSTNGPRCDPHKAFAAAQPLPITVGAGSGDDLSPRLSQDELTVYYSTNRPNLAKWVVVRATRSAIGGAFGAPQPVFPGDGTLANENELNPTVSASGTLMVFSASTRGDAGVTPFDGRVLFYATGPGNGTFTGPTSLLGGAYTSDDADPFLLPNASALYFTGNMGGPRSIYRATRQDAGGSAYGSPTMDLTELNTELSAPVVSADESTLFVSRGQTSTLTWDLYSYTRQGGVWSAPTRLDASDSTSLDLPSWISPDGCALYFSSNRQVGGGSGPMRMYVATRSL